MVDSQVQGASGTLQSVERFPVDAIDPPALLVAAEARADSDFAEAVIAVFDRDEEGVAYGIILNRPLGMSPRERFGAVFVSLPGVDERLFDGGPVPDAIALCEFRNRGRADRFLFDSIAPDQAPLRPWLSDKGRPRAPDARGPVEPCRRGAAGTHLRRYDRLGPWTA